MSINLTVVIDNDEAIRKFRELQKTAKTVTSSVVTDADRMDIAMRRPRTNRRRSVACGAGETNRANSWRVSTARSGLRNSAPK